MHDVVKLSSLAPAVFTFLRGKSAMKTQNLINHTCFLSKLITVFTLQSLCMSANVISLGETDRRQLIGEQTRLRSLNSVLICVGDEIEGCEDDTLRLGLRESLFEQCSVTNQAIRP
jgi:hypothetical protein